MTVPDFFPLHEERERLLRHCKLAPHEGVGRVKSHGAKGHSVAEFTEALRKFGVKSNDAASSKFSACCVFPASGNCLLFMRWPSDERLSQNFGEGLTVNGEGPNGPFEIDCPSYYVRAASPMRERTGWSVASPINEPLSIRYGEPRRSVRVSAIINNFDFEYGNVPEVGSIRPDGPVIRAEASGRTVDFRWRSCRHSLRPLLEADILPSSALAEFSFEAWPDATEEELCSFARDISSLCAVIARQHTGVPVLSFLDDKGRPIKRVVGNTVESNFHARYVVRDLHMPDGLPRLFQECFDEHRLLMRSALWRRMPFLFAAIEDPPYLEQKIATLMAAIELFIRNALTEDGRLTAEQINSRLLPGLIGSARNLLGWDIPKHYTCQDRHRLLRNASTHGNPLPGDIVEVRHDFDKWHLFLARRYLMRLGYKGSVASPQRGFASSSAVDDFSEEHNSFRT